jgi:hypothetical protein
MKNIKKYNEFLNENLQTIKDDDDTEFLRKTCKKCEFEQTAHLYMKTPVIIGKYKNYDLYINYVDINSYDNHLAFWIIWNERPDKLNGNRWDSSVIWEENGKLHYSDRIDEESVELFPNFIEIIADELKSYPNLDEWCKTVKEMGIKSRKYHRWAMQQADNREKGKPQTELTWEEKLDWVRNRIDVDKLLNRYSRPYDQEELDEMLKLGEEEYTKVNNKRNAEMMKILKSMNFKERINKKVDKLNKEENKKRKNG